MRGISPEGDQGRKEGVLFLKKKNQKNFIPGASNTKVFCFFFSKKKAFLPTLLPHKLECPFISLETSITTSWPTGPRAEHEFRSTDGGVCEAGTLMRPDRYAFFRGNVALDQHVIPRGAGLSFCGASFGAGSISVDMTGFDRVLDFDSATGQVRVEAGIALSDLLEMLWRRGRYLPIVPGYGSITVGGCIAADVHGKNPARDGIFSALVVSLRLFHPAHGIVTLSASEAPAVFSATCGGFGLTGIILEAVLRTQALPASDVESNVFHVADAAEAAAKLSEVSSAGDFAHAWLDFAQPHRHFGRGHVTLVRLVSGKASDPVCDLHPPGAGLSRVGRLPIGLMNRWTIRAINAAYMYRHRRPKRAEGFAASIFPIHGNELYFTLFGKAGFHEYQAILPAGELAHYVEAMRVAAERFGACVTLGILKLFDGKPTFLRFDGRGVSLAIEVRRDRTSLQFLEALDAALISLGGRPNLIKDSRLPRWVFEETCPEADRFRHIRREWDRKRLFRSEMSERLGL